MPAKLIYKPEFVEQASNYCELGAIDDDLAKFFGVSKRQIITWRKKYPEFGAACEAGKDSADKQVQMSLFKRAIGQVVTETSVKKDSSGKIKEKTINTKHILPDTTACIFWMKNRDPENWKDVHKLDHGGQKDNPIKMDTTISPSDAYLKMIGK